MGTRVHDDASGISAGEQLEALLDELIAVLHHDDPAGESDAEGEPTLRFGPPVPDPTTPPQPPHRPSGSIQILTDPLTAMPSRVAGPSVAVEDTDARVARLMNSALEAVLGHRYATALEALREVVRLQPDHSLANTNIARLTTLGVS